MSFISSQVGWALSPGSSCTGCARISETSDTGAHWSTRTASLPVPGTPQGVWEGLIDLDFVNAEDGYLFVTQYCPANCVLATHDGGRNWQTTTLPATSQLVNGTDVVYALSQTNTGRSPQLFRNAPGQSSWTRVTLPITAPKADTNAGFSIAAEQGTVVLLQRGRQVQPGTSDQLGELWISTDQGQHWISRSNPCTVYDGGAALVSIALNHPDALLLDCYDDRQSSQEQDTQHHLYGSADAGISWVRLADPSHTGAPEMLADNGAGHAFLVTLGGFGYQLHVTLDGAATWHTALTGGSGGFGMGDLRFVTAGIGYVLGPTHYATEHIYRTEDGGRTWNKIGTPSASARSSPPQQTPIQRTQP